MKALEFIGDPVECARVRDLLASHGIPTYRGKGMRFTDGGMLFVCLNHQFEDAVAVLKDPNHVVADPVDVEEFDRALLTRGFGTILRWGVAFVVVLSLLFGALLKIHYLG